MKRLMVLAVLGALSAASASAQQPPPDDTPITTTFGDINRIVNARVADALAQDAMKRLNEQIAAHAPPAPSPAPGNAPPPRGALPAPPAPYTPRPTPSATPAAP